MEERGIIGMDTSVGRRIGRKGGRKGRRLLLRIVGVLLFHRLPICACLYSHVKKSFVWVIMHLPEALGCGIKKS